MIGRKAGMAVAGIAVVSLLVGCSNNAPVPAPPARPVTGDIARPPENIPTVEDAEFAEFISTFRNTALAAGITAQTYDMAMAGVRYEPRVLNRNATQPEFVKPVWTYLDDAILPRIAPGQARVAAHAEILANIEAKYGVPKEIVVAIWGNETDFGKILGRYNLFSALANLAFRGPRTGFARPQLLAALTMLQEQNLNPNDMVSSWAGAFGQTQFVPTSFLSEAVDGDGDGRIDLWHSAADALASSAHLLADAGWVRNIPWGYEVRLPEGFAYELADPGVEKPAAFWAGLGVVRADGASLAGADAALFLPAGARGPAFLLTANFRVILKYNAATSYALAVCLLADRIKGMADLTAPWPRSEPQMNLAERRALQDGLRKLGFDPGPVDGVLGTKTRAALRAYQVAHKLAADGYANLDVAKRIADETGAPAMDAPGLTAAP